MFFAGLACVWAVEPPEREAAAAGLLAACFAAGVLIGAARISPSRSQPIDERSREALSVADGETRRTRRLTAQARASELLRAHLNEAQREELDRAGSFVVVARNGRPYRISATTTFNVRDETEREEYCLQFRTDRQCRGIPLEDLMLAQKVLIECDEAHFLRVANKRCAAEALDFLPRSPL